MYEPIRTKSVHSTMADGTPDFPHRTREEELDIQLAGHLAALLAVTDELRAHAPSDDLDTAADRLARQVTRLRGGSAPARAPLTPATGEPHLAALHRRAHTLAGRALVVAASRADTAAAILTAERMDAHAAALEPRELTAH
ncbi:SCO4983 family protein [Streptomyces flavalbus]|uniref:HPt domain-containing protein n=1 Tax=Streptomyces flavalbus TaxID=2665155 RepID=A0ABW2WCT6_9ACTN